MTTTTTTTTTTPIEFIIPEVRFSIEHFRCFGCKKTLNEVTRTHVPCGNRFCDNCSCECSIVAEYKALSKTSQRKLTSTEGRCNRCKQIMKCQDFATHHEICSKTSTNPSSLPPVTNNKITTFVIGRSESKTPPAKETSTPRPSIKRRLDNDFVIPQERQPFLKKIATVQNLFGGKGFPSPPSQGNRNISSISDLKLVDQVDLMVKWILQHQDCMMTASEVLSYFYQDNQHSNHLPILFSALSFTNYCLSVGTSNDMMQIVKRESQSVFSSPELYNQTYLTLAACKLDKSSHHQSIGYYMSRIELSFHKIIPSRDLFIACLRLCGCELSTEDPELVIFTS